MSSTQAMKQRVSISDNDRVEIEQMWKAGATVNEIADALGTGRGAIYNELRRGFDGTALSAGRCGYSAAVGIEAARAGALRKDAARRRPRRRVVRR